MKTRKANIKTSSSRGCCTPKPTSDTTVGCCIPNTTSETTAAVDTITSCCSPEEIAAFRLASAQSNVSGCC